MQLTRSTLCALRYLTVAGLLLTGCAQVEGAPRGDALATPQVSATAESAIARTAASPPRSAVTTAPARSAISPTPAGETCVREAMGETLIEASDITVVQNYCAPPGVYWSRLTITVRGGEGSPPRVVPLTEFNQRATAALVTPDLATVYVAGQARDSLARTDAGIAVIAAASGEVHYLPQLPRPSEQGGDRQGVAGEGVAKITELAWVEERLTANVEWVAPGQAPGEVARLRFALTDEGRWQGLG